LTPYDFVRLKNRVGISSDEFLDRYTIVIPKKDRLIPMVVLKMEEDKRCPFVSKEGCAVYADRPWPCRMYPLDLNDDGTLRLITNASSCHGLNEGVEQQVEDWLTDQGVLPYEEMNEAFSAITIPLQAQRLDIDNPAIGKMVFMALYNIDKFKDFVFQSTFLERFDVDQATVEKIQQNDLELLKFAFDWIKFGLLGEKLFSVKKEPEE
jgi:Fe-S-cluster containining protein